MYFQAIIIRMFFLVGAAGVWNTNFAFEDVDWRWREHHFTNLTLSFGPWPPEPI